MNIYRQAAKECEAEYLAGTHAGCAPYYLGRVTNYGYRYNEVTSLFHFSALTVEEGILALLFAAAMHDAGDLA